MTTFWQNMPVPRVPGFPIPRPRWNTNPVHPLLAPRREEPIVPFIPPEYDYESPEEESDEQQLVEEDQEEEDDVEDDEEEDEILPRLPPSAPSSAMQQSQSQHQHQHQQHQHQFQQQQRQRSLQPNLLIPLKVYRFRPSKHGWKHVALSGVRSGSLSSERAAKLPPTPPCSQIRIITWNIDMLSPLPEERMYAALRHIEEKVLTSKEGEAPEPCVILLQEVRDSVVPCILKHPWVQRWFAVTPVTKDKWPVGARYGNVTLVSRSIDIAEAHILHYGCTQMQRTAVCVKIKLNYPHSKEKAVISIVNTHLESLPGGEPDRPKQLQMCSRFLLLDGVDGGVIAGDMNTIGKNDATIGKDIGLKDAWRRGDMDDKGKTWGYQGQNEGQFPANRLDRIFYQPGMGYRIEEPKRIGVNLKVMDDSDQAVWVSDHYGLTTTLRMRGRSQSST